jgi:hypothetical protein
MTVFGKGARNFYLMVWVVLCFLAAASVGVLHAQTTRVSEKTRRVKQTRTNSSRQKKQGKSRKKLKQTKLISLKPGSWGASGVNLTIDENGASIDYDCANAEIDAKFAIAESGEFSFPGSYTRNAPGPLRIDRLPQSRPARFEGKIAGDKLYLRVILTDTDEKLEEVILERDTVGRIRRCY